MATTTTQPTETKTKLAVKTLKWMDRHEKYGYWVRLENDKGETVEVSIGENNYNKINALCGHKKEGQ